MPVSHRQRTNGLDPVPVAHIGPKAVQGPFWRGLGHMPWERSGLQRGILLCGVGHSGQTYESHRGSQFLRGDRCIYIHRDACDLGHINRNSYVDMSTKNTCIYIHRQNCRCVNICVDAHVIQVTSMETHMLTCVQNPNVYTFVDLSIKCIYIQKTYLVDRSYLSVQRYDL